jgi:hypothetical protein
MQSGWCLSDGRQGMLGFAVQDQIVRQFREKRKGELGSWEDEEMEKIRWSLDRGEWARCAFACLFLALDVQQSSLLS